MTAIKRLIPLAAGLILAVSKLDAQEYTKAIGVKGSFGYDVGPALRFPIR